MKVDRSELWNIFSMEEEYHEGIRDIYGRFPHYMSKNHWVFQAVVSEYLYKQGFRPEYPGGKDFAVFLSHDVDLLNISKFQLFKKVTKSTLSFNFTKAFSGIKYFFWNKIFEEYDPHRILEIEKKYEVNSTFYFMAIKPGEEHYNYDVKSINSLLHEIQKSGNEIGLHGGHEAYRSGEKLSEEKSKLKQFVNHNIQGYRNHYLRFDPRKTWKILEGKEFLYDSTLGFPGKAGFRNGMCYPFHPFDIETQDFLNIIEIPLVIMDFTLFNYMKLNAENALVLCKRLIEEVKKLNGVLSIQWHNTYMSDRNSHLYENLIEYLLEQNAWLTSGIEIINWWKQKNYCAQMEPLLLNLR